MQIKHIWSPQLASEKDPLPIDGDFHENLSEAFAFFLFDLHFKKGP